MTSLSSSQVSIPRDSSLHRAAPIRSVRLSTKQQDQSATLSVVVPTRNEADNIQPLIVRIDQALAEIPYELIFVDDSDDSTPQQIASVAQSIDATIDLIHRDPEQRRHGLGGAVLLGIDHAHAPLVCIMDGDLQHPPELIPALLQKAQEDAADLVIGSRFQEGGNAGGLNLLRLSISQSLDTLARLLFQRQLANVSDPMTGFFLVRKNKIDLAQLHPHGFKILLEILVRTPDLTVADVPFQFGVRTSGESKADLREGVRYFTQVAQLFMGEDTLRFLRFGLVGLSGIFVNLFFTYLFTDLFGLHYLGSAVVATQGSSLWNFILTETWVFKGRRPRWNRLYRLVMFLLMNNAALTVRGPIIFTLTTALGIHYLLSSLISILALTLFRYFLADVWIWKRESEQELYQPLPKHIV